MNEPIEIPPTNVPTKRLTKNLAVLIGNMITSSGSICGSVAVPAMMLSRLKPGFQLSPVPFAGKSKSRSNQLSIDTTRSGKSLGERVLPTQVDMNPVCVLRHRQKTFRSPVR